MDLQPGTPDQHSTLAATASPQPSSPFFSALPPEVRRMIYLEVWRHSRVHREAREQTAARTLKYHIVRRPSGHFAHSPCVVSDQNVHDARMERLHASAQSNFNTDTWARRVDSDWAVHWPCEEVYKSASRRRRSPFMAALLTCRLMYLEAIESLYSSLTFVFTDTFAAETFIALRPAATFRSIELCIRVPAVLPELYRPASTDSSGDDSSHPPLLTAHNNPWARLCRALARRPATGLRTLTVWVDIKHLKGWTGARVWERRFFEPLTEVEGVREFVLALPEVGGQSMLPVEAYFGSRPDDGDGEGLPFVVRRGPRPDYWAAHLARVRVRTRTPLLGIEAGPGHGGA